MGSPARAGVLATAVIALSCASLAGCDPQSNSAFHPVADPTPNAAAIQQQPPQTSGGDVATSTSNAYAAQPRSPQIEAQARTSQSQAQTRRRSSHNSARHPHPPQRPTIG